MMSSLQKVGGLAAMVMALSYLVGIAVFVTALNPAGPLEPLEQISFLVEKQSIIYLTMLFIYVVAGFALLVLVQTIHEQLKPHSSAMLQTATVIGFIWSAIVICAGMIYLLGMDSVIGLSEKDPAQAAVIWQTVLVVFEGLGGGTEIVGGVWMLLISSIALGVGIFPKPLNYLGLVVGIAGIITIVPMLKDATMLFGLGQIPWYLWVGVILFRKNNS